ncbi:Uncharacterised protein [Peptoniphilus harei]|uniref:Uncharacterized protein n=1 Tax=Peptoniphilus harei TaxID=54005 RepID=A0A2X1WZI1_9FIRM|nr:Uncharacterised protein [Peptoniphilus harei]
MFNLDINYNEKPRFTIVYEEKSQIMDILRILRDSYYLSIINKQKGVDDNKGGYLMNKRLDKLYNSLVRTIMFISSYFPLYIMITILYYKKLLRVLSV